MTSCHMLSLPFEVLILMFSFIHNPSDLDTLFKTHACFNRVKDEELFRKLWVRHTGRLKLAVQFGYLDIVKELYLPYKLAHENDSTKNIKKVLPYILFLAAKHHHPDIVAFLFEKDDFNDRQKDIEQAMRVAANLGHYDILDLFITPDTPHDMLLRCFFQACMGGHYEFIKYAKSKGKVIKINLDDAIHFMIRFVQAGNERAYRLIRKFVQKYHPFILTEPPIIRFILDGDLRWNIIAGILALKNGSSELACELFAIGHISEFIFRNQIYQHIIAQDNVVVMRYFCERYPSMDCYGIIFKECLLLEKWNILEYLSHFKYTTTELMEYMKISLRYRKNEVFKRLYNLLLTKDKPSEVFLRSFLCISFENNNEEIVTFLCDRMSPEEISAISSTFIIAIETNNLSLLKLLVKKGVRPPKELFQSQRYLLTTTTFTSPEVNELLLECLT